MSLVVLATGPSAVGRTLLATAPFYRNMEFWRAVQDGARYAFADGGFVCAGAVGTGVNTEEVIIPTIQYIVLQINKGIWTTYLALVRVSTNTQLARGILRCYRGSYFRAPTF